MRQQFSINYRWGFLRTRMGNGRQPVVEVINVISNAIWETGKWPSTTWIQSIIITIPKKGNLQPCNNYRTVSLISQNSKAMLMIILNRLKPRAENIIVNLIIMCDQTSPTSDKNIYHVFTHFKKVFDRVWHEELWATMTSTTSAGRSLTP